MTELRSEIVWTVGWKIVAELFRRHHASANLRVYETHPCSGQYDCLSLWCGDFPSGRHLCDFNQASSHLHVWSQGSPRKLDDLRWPEGNNYVEAYLRSQDPKDVVDQVESVIGLPGANKTIPSATAAVLSVRLLSEVLAGCAFDRFGLDVRNGFFDSSGMVPCEPRKELRSVPAIAAQIPTNSNDVFRFARRFWLLRRCSINGETNLKAILDMRGIVYAAQPPYKELHVWELYQANNQIRPIVERVRIMCNHK